MIHDLTRISPLARPDYRERISSVSEAVWPEFMLHDPIANEHWDGLFDVFGEYQFAFLGGEERHVVGIANSVPLAWDGSVEDLPEEGWDWALIQSSRDQADGQTPKILCALQISIHPEFQRRGLSTPALEEMLAAWRAITTAADPWLDSRTSADFLANVVRDGKPSSYIYGSLILRVIYHYWYHTGENMAIRQSLGHVELPEFVGDIDGEAPYRPEQDD